MYTPLLKKRFARNGEVDETDTRMIKKLLNRMGYYTPRAEWGITEIPDDQVFESLKRFQTDHKLPATGEIKPGDETEHMLTEAATKPKTGSYIWRTVEDEKVRSDHARYNRTVRQWADSPDPGDDYGCRCWVEKLPNPLAQIYDPPIEPVYPELLIPLAAIGRLAILWRIWSKANKVNKAKWTLGKHKSEIRWGNQIKNRDWTPEQITDTIKYGEKHLAPNNVHPGNKAIRYEYKGRFIVRDEKTKEILQISRPDFERQSL